MTRRLLTIFMCLLVLFGLMGCKTKKVVTESVLSLVTDSLHVGVVETENHAEVALYDDWGSIEFADSSGSLTIDGGIVSAKGVKSYHRGKHAALTRVESITLSKDSTATHRLQKNVAYDKRGVKALKWYQRTIYYIGALCCAAVGICVMLLYLRRKFSR